MTIRLLNFVFILLVVITTACGTKKCQAPATEKFKHITDTPWRLVETTDPGDAFEALSNTTFLVFEFTLDYKGTVKKVENNAEYEVPVLVFKYNVDPDNGRIRAQFTAPSEEGSTSTQSGGTIVDYDYDLGREFEMVNSKSGYYYRYVPYNGIIAPDDKCTF